MVAYGVMVISIGSLVYFIKAKLNNEWPFEQRIADEAITI